MAKEQTTIGNLHAEIEAFLDKWSQAKSAESLEQRLSVYTEDAVFQNGPDDAEGLAQQPIREMLEQTERLKIDEPSITLSSINDADVVFDEWSGLDESRQRTFKQLRLKRVDAAWLVSVEKVLFLY